MGIIGLENRGGVTPSGSTPPPSSKKLAGKRRPPYTMWKTFLKSIFIFLMYIAGLAGCMALAALMLITCGGNSL
jgi:hypothetical protein